MTERGFLVADRNAATIVATQKAFQGHKGFGFSYSGLFLLQLFRRAAQKQRRPMRIVKCFRGEPVFGFKSQGAPLHPPVRHTGPVLLFPAEDSLAAVRQRLLRFLSNPLHLTDYSLLC